MSLLDLADRFLTEAGPCAWLLESRRLGRTLWLVREPSDVALLTPEEQTLPVVTAAELPALRTLDDATLHQVLDAKGVFGPGTTVVEATP